MPPLPVSIACSSTLAVVALAFSVALVAVAGQKDRDATAVIATYFLFAGFQMLLAMYFLLQQQALKSMDSLPRAKRATVWTLPDRSSRPLAFPLCKGSRATSLVFRCKQMRP